MIERQKHDTNTVFSLGLDVVMEEIPPYLRLPERGTREATVHMIARIDNKIARLAALGLHPHPNMVGYRQELSAQLDNGGPYKLRVTSAFF